MDNNIENISQEELDKALNNLSTKNSKVSQWDDISKTIHKRQRIKFIRNVSAIASVVVIFIASYVIINSGSQSHNYIAISTNFGQQETITLPDGSSIVLNGGSTLRYDDSNFSENRKVEFEGEAVFDITKSENNFVVKMKTSKVVVYGTKFNINNYSNDQITTVTLNHGKIDFRTENFTKTLKPNEQIVYNKNSNNLKLKEVDADVFSAWENRNLHFRMVKIVDVAKTLTRYFGKEIIVSNQIKNIEFSGDFVKNEKIEDIFEILELTANIKIETKDNKFYLKQ